MNPKAENDIQDELEASEIFGDPDVLEDGNERRSTPFYNQLTAGGDCGRGTWCLFNR